LCLAAFALFLACAAFLRGFEASVAFVDLAGKGRFEDGDSSAFGGRFIAG
jgi:hypothetical protein